MAEAPDDRRWAIAAELAGQPRVPLTCCQWSPYEGRCSADVRNVCDACDKALCPGHTQPVHAGPRMSDLVDGEELLIDPNPSECCTTCVCLFYQYRVNPVQLSDDERVAWLITKDAIGYVGEHEERFLRSMGYEPNPRGGGWQLVPNDP